MKLLKRGVILVLSMILISCSQDVKTDLSPEDHVYEAYLNTFTRGGLDMTAKMDMNINFYALDDYTLDRDLKGPMMEILDNMDFEFNFKGKTDLDNKKFDYNLDYRMDYQEKNLIDAKMFLNLKKLDISILNFYDKYFVLNYESLLTLIRELDLGTKYTQIDYSKYFNIIVNKIIEHKDAFSNTKYDDMIKAHLKDHLSEGLNEVREYEINGEMVSKNVLTYEYNVDMEGIMLLIYNVFSEIEHDPEIKVVYKDIAKAVFDELVDSKDYLWFSSTELVMMDEAFDAFVDEAWERFFEGFGIEFNHLFGMYRNDMVDELQSIYDSMTYKISIDEDMTITDMHVAVDSPLISFNIEYQVNAIGDDVVIEKKPADSINVIDHIDFENQVINDKEGFAKIVKEILLSAIDELQSGEGIQLLIKDLSEHEEELEIDFSTFNVFLDEATEIVKGADWVSEIDSMFDDFRNAYLQDNNKLPELTNIALITIDESELSSSLQYSAESRALGYIEYKSTEPLDRTVFVEAYNAGATLIFIEDERLKDAAIAAAKEIPDMQIMALFSDGYLEFPLNMYPLLIEIKQPAYVAGYTAGLVTKTNRVGFVAGIDDYKTYKYQRSFESGVEASNPKAEVIVKSLGVDDNKDLALPTVEALNGENVDVIYHDAGLIGEGIIDAVEQYDIWAIGNNSDYGKDNEHLLTYHRQNLGRIAESIISYYDYRRYDLYYYYYGLHGNYIMFEQMNLNDEVWPKVLDMIDQISNDETFILIY